MILFELLGKILLSGADTAQEDMDKTTAHASNLGSTLATGIGTVASWGAAIGTAAVAAGTAAATGLVQLAQSTASATDRIDKMSQKIGISRTAFQELDFICSQSGTTVDGLQAGMKTLTGKMQSASEGSVEAAATFEKLGVSIYDSNGSLKDQETMLFEIIAVMQSMHDGTEKAALANDLLGRSGTELMPLLNGAAGSVQEMRNQAHELGLVINDETINSGVAFTDTMDQLQRSFEAVGMQLGGAMLPIIQEFANFLISNMPTLQNMVAEITPIAMDLLNGILPILVQIVESLLPMLLQVITSLIPPISSIIQSVLPQINELMSTMLPLIANLITELLPGILELMDALLPVIVQVVKDLLPPLVQLLIAILPLLPVIIQLLQPVLDLLLMITPALASVISNGLVPLVSQIVVVAENISMYLLPAIEMIRDVVAPVMDFVCKQFEDGFNSIKQILDDIVSFIQNIFSGNFSGALEDILDILKIEINSFVGAIEGGMNLAIKGVNALIAGFNLISLPEWLGGGSISIPLIPEFSIPRLEKGGILEKGQIGFLEGNGAEAVVPLEKSDKWLTAMAVKMNNIQGGGTSSEVISKLDELIDAMKSIRVYLDTGVLVGEIAPEMDNKLGNMSAMKGRYI